MNPKSWVQSALHWAVRPSQFRLYTQPSPPAAPGGPKRIAVCDLIPNLGDTAMVFPLLDAIAEENPGAEIVCFTQGIARELRLHPAVTKVYEFRRKDRLLGRLGYFGHIHEMRRWWKQELQGERFHAVVCLRGGADPFHSRYLAYMLGGQIRAGYDPALEPERSTHDFGGTELLTHVVREMHGIHEVERGWEVLHLAGLVRRPMELQRPVASLRRIAGDPAAVAFRQSHLAGDELYAVIAPGASVPRRAWPAERFAELARREVLPRGLRPVLLGGPETRAMCEEIGESLGVAFVNLAGRTSFAELAAVCGGASLFLGNDSGIGHIAGACGVPSLIVTAYAASGAASHHASPWRSHPVGPWFAIAQPDRQRPPCQDECVALEPQCILDVSVDEAQRGLQAMLRGDASVMKPR